MKTKLLILLLTLQSTFSFGQQTNDKIDYITFKLQHSRRIPNHKVSIEIIKNQSEVVVKVKSNPMKNDKQWENTKIDTTFLIDKNKFIELSNRTSDLYNINLDKALINGKDGTECVIEFGAYGYSVSYKFWSPNYDTEERELIYFLDFCKVLIELGGLQPKDIL